MTGSYESNELTQVKICTSLDVPSNKFIDAAEAAIEENPDNATMRRGPNGRGRDSSGPFELALTTEKLWSTGRVLRVRFLDGTASVQNKVKDFAKEWENHANIKLDFVDSGAAEIRVSFQQSGSWSYLGTDNLVIDPTEATMNFGWLDEQSTDEEYSRVVIHEFGHALAAIHEHQNPVAGIPWNEDAVFRYYRITQGWTDAQTFHNVLRRHDASKTNFSQFDPKSIMQYAVPNALTIDDFEIGWNRVLSDMDKQFIGTIYPGKAPAERVLNTGETVDAEIGEPGEEDHYTFSLNAHSSVTLETSGHTDVVMSLFGPADRTRLLDVDDDSGRRLNAKIETDLDAGDYYVRIRHYSKRRGGPYSVTLTA